MATIIDAIAYILKEYPHKSELSNARVTKILYLADWYCAINDSPPVTSINWYFDNHGPFVWDVKNAVEGSNIARVVPTINQYGSRKNVLELLDKDYNPSITDDEKEALDHIIEVTKGLYWSDFITLVYSTHPVSSSEKYTYLNLPEKAKEYAQINR